MEYIISTGDGLGTATTKSMIILEASGTLAWAAGRNINPSLWKDMSSRQIDLHCLIFTELR